MSPLQRQLMGMLRPYRDVLYASRDAANADALRDIYTLHLLDHIYQTRDRIIKNNTRLAKQQSNDELRDQGFTRPKVLVVLPTRGAVVRLVDALIRLCGCDSVQNRSRFEQEYGTMKEINTAHEATSKPADYVNYFAGNPDDHFRLGIRFTRKMMKLCSEFYSSDVIVASPLGLRTIIGARGDKKRDFDFLSSIEILIMDQADSFLMQNWDHVEHLLKHTNLIPQESRDCDFSRVKNWYLDGRARYLRQTLIFAEYLTPELNSVFNKYCSNIRGKFKLRRENEAGTINDVALPIQQIFTRIECTSVAKAADQRFEHFKEKVFPALQQSAVQQSRTMIFIPSYYDYVRIRNYLDERDINFVDICEYSEPSDISRSRTAFFHGDCDFMLYTERVHFYHRYRIRGAQHIFFYQLPEHAHFYPELLSVLSDAADGLRDLTISALYSRYDQLRLERIVGTSRALRMIQGEKPAYLFA
ncbi:digestive organ expansion factor-like protein [Syncephalis pseudoplumigaleata]|uniref:U3 small nucleolar RNA-associated protein 25 n=1 Tax=Syncephalis pseudoplumigaleata TaxID=1712513 RepID=A0A4P9Z013_9FUNG|nr:digestive organ expansion factor-like protein [Syncephalis pseudoplumigaleata]|eukprot:RKP25777.1 digestive organ expansion factor-like protein [Syncephalis pseudoplumigaleata]